MKNVYTSLDINLLADKMMEKIQESWKSPFCSPAVVFTDPKTEQWFKLHWLKKQGTGNSILMNLKTLRIQQFLFDLVTPKSPDSRDIQKLSVEMLRDVIITKLTEENAGKYYFEPLGAPEVVSYLTSKNSDSKINANHLYDFSETVASLFMDYEDTRPDTLNEVLDKSSWQKKLYSDVTGTEGIKIKDTRYLTLFQLAELNKKANNSSLAFNWPSDRPVFIFGFSGLGQIYRNILNDFSKEHALEVFLQAMEYEDSPENQLLGKWAEFGRDHLQLWTKDSPAQKPNAADSFTKTDTILHRIQKSIAENLKLVQEPFDTTDNSLTLTAAPTRLREVEALHTKICQLLSDEKQKTQLGDILIVAPQIQDYKTVIEQVFDQTDQFSADSAFPYIPYTIADFSGERSLTAEALNILFGILKKGYLSRSDVFALLHNYLVQSVRGISDEEISDWADWSANLNIYRDREGHEEWQKAKTRLLLARLTTDLTEIGGAETNDRQFLPYESMSTTNNDSLYKFIQVIDELEEWESYSTKEKFSIEDISQLERLLKNWLLLSDDIPDGLYNETLVFQNVIEEIERQRLTIDQTVFADCFANALFDRSAAVSLHSANILTRGITFANFESNRVLSAKYIFFMGLDSKAFPGVDTDNELDLRNIIENRQTGGESIPLKNKNAFLCQLMAAREGFYLSYVNKNLQKDEDYFMSSVLKDLFETVYLFDKDAKKQIYENQISIDETRPWKDLFTQREFRNKLNYIKLQENKSPVLPLTSTEASVPDSKEAGTNLPDRITISQMKRFLEEPFVYMVNRTLNDNRDEDEKEQVEFEPLFLDNIISSEIRTAYVKAVLQNNSTAITKEKLTFILQNENVLPDSYFGDKSIDNILRNSDNFIEKIKERELDSINFIFDENKIHQIKQIPDITPKDWYISGDLAWYNSDYSSSKKITTLELTNSEKPIIGYITSLILIASQPDEVKTEFQVELNVGLIKEDKQEIIRFGYSVSPELARIILNEIYRAMFITEFHKSIPVKTFLDELENDDPDKALNFSKFKDKLTSSFNGEWQFFSKRKLFDIDKDIGYTEETFKTEWKKSMAHQDKIILYREIKNTNSRGGK